MDNEKLIELSKLLETEAPEDLAETQDIPEVSEPQPVTPDQFNIAQSLVEVTENIPFRPAMILSAGRDKNGRAKFTQYSFYQFNQLVDGYAHGLSRYGIQRGDRTLMLIRPDIEMVAVTFALLKMGAVPVLIDPGMGRKPFLKCVAETEPSAFIGISLAHGLRKLFPKAFKTVKRNITVGKRWFWGGAALKELYVTNPQTFPVAPTTTEDEAAIVFTSGSTGIPKGVVYLHGMLQAMVKFLHRDLDFVEGAIDMPGLPIFILLNPIAGRTTVIPEMDARKPATLNPAYLVEAIKTHGVTTSFGSPTIWKIVGRYCLENNIQLPSLKRIWMAGAPVSPQLIEEFTEKILTDGEISTPFGATEALPVSNINGNEILAETAALTEQGWGVCVGHPLNGLDVRVIAVSDEAVEKWDDSLTLPSGELGEIAVKGPVVTRIYLNRPQQTALSKIEDADGIWHRMGDLGYFDNRGRLWMCGRKSHRVETEDGLMLPVPCEAIFNAHPNVARSALVGIGPLGKQRPVLVVELLSGQKPAGQQKKQLIEELLTLGQQYEHTMAIKEFLFHPSFPVDVRHNVKIQREKLAVWAAQQR